MRIFVSHSHHDKPYVDRIVNRLQADGHDVWTDSRLRPGDNFQIKIQEALESTDALIVVISENSFRSRYVQHEFSAIALQQISTGERRIIPVRIDHSPVPSYIADRIYIDMSGNFESALDALSAELKTATPESMAAGPEVAKSSEEARSSQIERLSEALRRGRLTLVCGAGVSVEAGVPAWGDLLVRLLETMMEQISKNYSVKIGKKAAAAAEFQRRHGASSLILGKYLKNNLGKDFQRRMRDALYASPPGKSLLIESIAELSRPQRDARPLDSIITFNFDGLIEERLIAERIPNKPIFSEAIEHAPTQLPIYHVHGYLPRTGRISGNTDLVFSEDAYHSQFIDQFSWSNLIQLTKLTQNTCLFVGISLTDPNMRRLLDVAWRKNPDKRLSHYMIKKVPHFPESDVLSSVSKLLEEQDANALGLNIVWIEDFSEIPKLLLSIASGKST